MLFNSIDFALFLPTVFILYWFVVNRNLKLQNLFIVVASFTFYGWWNWRFLALLFSGSVINYSIGRLLLNQTDYVRRKLLLWCAIVYNIGLLIVFKYLNFFIESFSSSFSFLGFHISGSTLNIVLPVGISFFTFQALGYVIEVFRGNIKPTKDIISFSAFISFFPLILAGPIERANHLLPQFHKKRFFDYSQATDGLRQILWGLFKKIVIADNCAVFANMIFNNSTEYSGSTLVLGALFYTIQIYADFSGYSDIAIGVSRLFGFDIIRNFNFPYLAVSVADFWRRWHISLSSWFRDYLFTPISIKLRSWGMTGIVFSLFITFLLCGLWHGANYTFIAWGCLQGLALGFDVASAKNRKKIRKKTNPTLYNLISWIITFSFIVCTWVLFRTNNLHHALSYFKSMLLGLVHKNSYIESLNFVYWKISYPLPLLICLFLLIEWLGREQQYAIAQLGLKWKRPLRHAMYYAFILAILINWFGGNEQQYIYFQF
jgi:alginate O-acetyltransferase complex protein AlgI